MFTALISTIIQGFANIFWKKSLNYGVGGKAHDILSYLVAGIIVLYFFITGVDLSNINYIVIILSAIVLLSSIIRTSVAQKLYKEEKMSVILPYTNINKILTIIFSFFIFSDVSFVSLIITIVAIFVIILFSIDLKTLKFPKKIGKILFVEFGISLNALLSGRIVLNYGEISYFILAAIIGFIFLLILSLSFGELKSLKGLPNEFWISRYIGALGWLSWLLSLVVIKNLGLSISILLSFFGIGITLILSLFVLNDKPSKKNLLMTLIVCLLVGLGFYFK